MNKMLMLATVPSMIGQFNMNNIEILKSMDYEIHVACNFNDISVWNTEIINGFKKKLKDKRIIYHDLPVSRSPYRLISNYRSYKILKKILKEEQFCFLHCHTPVGGMIGRLAGKSTKTKVIYTAHGFHFYKGAPLKNWILFYPVERLLALLTETLITINSEDYQRVEKWKIKNAEYVPGTGIELEKFVTEADQKQNIRMKKRTELGVTMQTNVILSVGELNNNKNHKLVIEALGNMVKVSEDFHYYICGQGELEQELQSLICRLGLEDKITLLGYRTDIAELYLMADLFIFPSFREGLSVSLMEAMACGLPVICSGIRGNVDLIDHKKGGYHIDTRKINAELLCRIVMFLMENEDMRKRMGNYNSDKVVSFSDQVVKERMKVIYGKYLWQ